MFHRFPPEYNFEPAAGLKNGLGLLRLLDLRLVPVSITRQTKRLRQPSHWSNLSAKNKRFTNFLKLVRMSESTPITSTVGLPEFCLTKKTTGLFGLQYLLKAGTEFQSESSPREGNVCWAEPSGCDS